MGSFYSNIHVKTDRGKDGFIEALNRHLSAANYEKCDEDDAVLSYRLAFSDGWVTFVRPEYRDQPDVLEKEAKNISAAFKTSVFTTTVVDSDFAELSLFDNGEQADYAVIGEGDAYGLDETPADPAKWQPLLKQGTAFEELSAVWETDEVFCEDALYKSAPLFGIEPDFMTADDRSLDDDNSVLLCFREKAASSAAGNSAIKLAPKLTLSKAFKNAFGEVLEPLGFKYLKGNFFYRIIGGEIIQGITYENVRSTGSGHIVNGTFVENKYFAVHAGATTVYEETVYADDFTFSNPRRYPEVSRIYSARGGHGNEKWKIMAYNPYCPALSEDIVRAVNLAMEHTKELLPFFEKVTDLESYLFYDRMAHFGTSTHNAGLYFPNEKELREKISIAPYLALLYVKTKYGGDFKEQILDEASFNSMAEDYKARGINAPEYKVSYSEYYAKECSLAEKKRAELDVILNDPELCSLVDKELERRKAVNTESLAKIGIKL